MKDALINLFRLTKREYFADFFITTPITVIVGVLSIYNFWSPLWLVQFALGMFVWTFYEYAAHRWVLHKAFFFRDMHDLHHENQKDYIALPPVATITLYLSMWALLGVQSHALIVGFSTGYVIYSALHTAFHYARIPVGHVLYHAKRRHALHHKFDNKFYGVTTPLWDMVFNTR